MPALIPTKFSAKVTWLGLVPDRHSDLCAVPQTELMMRFSGPEGDSHSGLTRPSCSRVTSQHPRGTEIRNVRQLSIVSAEDLQEIAATIGLEVLDPAWLGATLVLSGFIDFSHLPPGSRLQATNGTTLVIDMENRPCNLPARVIEKAKPGHGKAFMKSATGRRGVTAWVEREGALVLGDHLRLHIPDQPAWIGLAAAKS